MAPRKWIDKNNATTYKLVHRPQNDPLIHDASASSMVFQEVDAPQASKRTHALKGDHFGDSASEIRSRDDDLTSEFSLRENEGEAAEYGVYYDDTEYDYMQHLRDLGSGDGEAHFIEAIPAKVKGNKGKGKDKEKGISLEEALAKLDIEHEQQQQKEDGRLLDESILPSKHLKRMTYQDQQDVPDSLKGFQPDMDWRLREALEALEDEEYVDNDDQDLFDMLAQDGEEIDDDEFEEAGYELEDEGWESDHTAKPEHEYRVKGETPNLADTTGHEMSLGTGELPPSGVAPPDAPTDPFAAFHAHKAESKLQSRNHMETTSVSSAVRKPRIHDGAAASTILTNASFMSGRRKKRKGAMTNQSSYSMTSSALARTEGQTLLDARFDRVLETQYEDDEELVDGDDDGTASVATGVTGRESIMSGMSAISRASGISTASSRAPDLVRKDYSGVMNMMDDFLGGFGAGPSREGDGGQNTKKSRKARRGYGGQTGIEQLDEIRKELGRPRVAGVR